MNQTAFWDKHFVGDHQIFDRFRPLFLQNRCSFLEFWSFLEMMIGSSGKSKTKHCIAPIATKLVSNSVPLTWCGSECGRRMNVVEPHHYPPALFQRSPPHHQSMIGSVPSWGSRSWITLNTACSAKNDIDVIVHSQQVRAHAQFICRDLFLERVGNLLVSTLLTLSGEWIWSWHLAALSVSMSVLNWLHMTDNAQNGTEVCFDAMHQQLT